MVKERPARAIAKLFARIGIIWEYGDADASPNLQLVTVLGCFSAGEVLDSLHGFAMLLRNPLSPADSYTKIG